MLLRLLPALLTVGAVVASTPAVAQSRRSDARVLVLPFDNPSREPRLYWLTEGASLLLTDELTVRGVDAISREERREAFERMQVPPLATLSRASVIRLGELVGAGDVVIGTVTLSGDTLEVRARRIQLGSGHMDQDQSERGPLADLFSIVERLASRVMPAANRVAERARPQPSPAVYENYVKGLVAESSAAQQSYLQAALKAAPDFDRARLALWDLHTEQGEHAAALGFALAVPASSPHRREAQFMSALSEIQLARYESAFSRLKMLQSEASSAAVLNNLGVVQLRRGSTPQTGRAAYFFNEAVKLAPDDPDPAFNLGYAYWIDRDVSSAVFFLRETVRINPADGDAHAVLAAALQASGATTEAARERELARQLSSEYAEWEKRSASVSEPVRRGLERIKLRADRRRTDSIDVALLQKEQREVAAFHLDRGRRLFDQGEDREAIAELRRSLYLSPYQAEAHRLLGRLYLRSGRITDAIDALTISLWSEETVAARIALADAYLTGGDAAAARREIDRALVLDPTSIEAKALLNRLPTQKPLPQ